MQKLACIYLILLSFVACKQRGHEGRLAAYQECVDARKKLKESAFEATEYCSPKVTLDVEGSSVEGGLSQHEVVQGLKTVFPKARQCYAVELDEDYDLKGSLVFKWQIDSMGKVKALSLVEQKSTLADNNSLMKCVKTLVGKIQFLKPRIGAKTKIEYGFVFAPL